MAMWSFKMSKKIKTQPDDREQAAAFRKAAREAGCNDNEERFKEALRTVAKQKPKEAKERPSGD
jgi:hypothetical protein